MHLDASNIAAQATPRSVRLADYQPPPFLVDHVALEFDLDEAATTVAARLKLRRNPAAPQNAPLRLDGQALTLLHLARDGETLGDNHYHIEDGSLIIPDMPDACELTVRTRIAPEGNTELSGLYVSNGSFFTQCEAEGFRRITWFPDRPDVMARYTVTITADKARIPVMLSNGNPGDVTDLSDGRHRITWTDPHPKPSYLFALVAGDLVAVKDSFTTRSGRTVDLGIWVRRGDEDRCDHAMRSLKTAMKWDEDVFGLEYDLDVFNIAAVSDFNMGAMENKGLNVFNTKYVLADEGSATDGDFQGIETVIAHEYFHNWTGDRVTCRDWFQLSLKEGLTVYRDQEFTADQGSRAVKRIGDVRVLRAGQFREDAGPLAHPVQPTEYMAIDNFYTATVYQKGAEVIRMMATIIGRDAFRRGMDLYFARHDNNAVTIDDFVAAMQDASGVDLGAFKLWYHQAGTPEVSVEDAHDPATNRYTLTLRQTTPPTPGQPDKRPLVIPVAMGLIADDGSELATRLAGETGATPGTRVLLLTDNEQKFEFEDVAALPTPSLLRGFSAPVKLSGISLDRLQFLATSDTDPFVRWEAGQQYAARVLLEQVEKWQPDATVDIPAGIVAAAVATLSAADADRAFAAEALTLPSETFLADQMRVANPDAIHAVRQAARGVIGTVLAPILAKKYQELADDGPYRIDGESIGRRALRNTCLAYLAAGVPKNGATVAKQQFDTWSNMTDVLAALSVLSHIDGRERTSALKNFYNAWHEVDLVLDKWFAIQAMSELATPEVVRRLTEHKDFDLRNPNRVRALVSSFVSGNPARFHDASGEGYRFLADIIIELDPRNPQVAARMVAPLGQWRRFDVDREALMQRELQRILESPGLSRNTFEMVSKSLA
ncbi:MAG TPA: aminopeptidase N [Acetobacteraceae bacterium]|nr:aminopeptidase N [Acetobacteraceae bacterium]